MPSVDRAASPGATRAGTPPASVTVRVPAKVNLHLAVGPVRPDGYHDLVTVFQAVAVFDEVTVSAADELALTVRGTDAAQVPADGRNLAWRAATSLAAAVGVPPRVALHLDKAIPVAGGMAGGSADAAAALLGCAALWGVDDPALLRAVAARLGSDVAFPLLGGTAVGRGRGELLEPVPCATTLHWVFATAGFGIGAGDAYRELDRQRGAGTAPVATGAVDDLLAALAGGDVAGVATSLANDLQPAALALAPSLAGTLAAADGHDGVLAAIVSGSGPTCAFLCQDATAATSLAVALERQGLCRAARPAVGPVRGATVLTPAAG